MADSVRLTPEEAKKLEIYDPHPAARTRMRSVKLFTDGALGSWGAALLAPYSDKPDARGIMRLPEEELESVARGWWERGWAVVSSISCCSTVTDLLKCAERSCNRRPCEQGRTRCLRRNREGLRGRGCAGQEETSHRALADHAGGRSRSVWETRQYVMMLGSL